jgi:hypothetical protein
MQGNCLMREFLDLRAQLEDRLYLPATIAYHAAPVYSGLKPSVLINLGRLESKLARMWIKYRQDVDNLKSLSMVVFHGVGGCLQLFCYDAGHLEQIIADRENRAYLESMGSSSFHLNDSIAGLKEGFRRGCPHEIGIFLGYPLSDVKAFIRYNGRYYLMNGYWKVYSNVPYAVRMFQAFDHAKEDMLRKWKNQLQLDRFYSI